MALVANYSSSEESDIEEEEVVTPPEPSKSQANSSLPSKSNDDIHISDEEDEFQNPGSGILDETSKDIPGLSSKGLFQSLSAKTKTEEKVKKDFVDIEEDLSSIPQANESEKSSAPLKPIRKKGRKGPVRIMAPSLKDFSAPDDSESLSRASNKFTGAKTKSTLLSILPQPKNAVSQPAAKTTIRSLVPDSVRKRPLPTPQNPAKVAKIHPSEASDSEDEEGPTSFFTLESEKISEEAAANAVKAALPRVHANPEALEPKPSPSRSDSDRVLVPEREILAPDVGPSRPVYPVNAYPDADDLMANTDALERLAGKHALKHAEGIDVVDVNAKALQADPREWMVKALTEEDADKPGPRNNIKGQTKRKHQITYLAAQAKENEHKLKAQWANSAANKRAAGAKYGFF